MLIESIAKCAKLVKTGTDARFSGKGISGCQVADDPLAFPAHYKTTIITVTVARHRHLVCSEISSDKYELRFTQTRRILLERDSVAAPEVFVV